jgi:phosphoribosylanthranilate isomerase
MKLKVCGMKYKDNIEAVAALQPDFMGFIFYDKSDRFFTGQIPELPDSIQKVGVFVNEDLKVVTDTIEKHNLDVVQLHGNESAEFCQNLKNITVIKVFSIKDSFDFRLLQPYESVCNYYLFDTKGALPGGNGYGFDWNVLKNYPSTKPYFLSGGIGLNTLENLSGFKKSSVSKYCYAVDVNSKFEQKPGLKKIEELEKFKHELQR